MHAGPVRRSAFNTVANYFVRGLAGGRLRALTEFKAPTPQLTGVQKRLVTYTREDGIPLSGTLYLPPGYARAGGGKLAAAGRDVGLPHGVRLGGGRRPGHRGSQ